VPYAAGLPSWRLVRSFSLATGAARSSVASTATATGSSMCSGSPCRVRERRASSAGLTDGGAFFGAHVPVSATVGGQLAMAAYPEFRVTASTPRYQPPDQPVQVGTTSLDFAAYSPDDQTRVSNRFSRPGQQPNQERRHAL
jgi:hypothetical protein